MTLVMSLHGSDYTLMLSDRRLSCNGRMIEDESNKATAIITDDAKLACAFTGLARCGNFSTQDWLLEALLECGPPDHESVPILQRLTKRFSEEFRNNSDLRALPREAKRLALLFAGLHFAKEGIFHVSALLTNFSGFAGQGDLPYEPTDFVLREIEMNSPSRVGFTGAWSAITGDDVAALNGLLTTGKSANAVLGKAIEVFHSAADRAEARESIGGQLNSILIRSGRSDAIETGYHVRNASSVSYMANMAVLTSKDSMLMKGGQFYESDTDGNALGGSKPIVFPKVHRNAHCPCGSKKRYRKCHGKHTKF